MTHPTMQNISVNLEKTEELESESFETNLAATDKDLLILAEKLSEAEVPLNVLLQALSIAAYDSVSAFRYADNYLNNLKKQVQPEIPLVESFPDFKNN